jgi:hypothetical protein
VNALRDVLDDDQTVDALQHHSVHMGRADRDDAQAWRPGTCGCQDLLVAADLFLPGVQGGIRLGIWLRERLVTLRAVISRSRLNAQ